MGLFFKLTVQMLSGVFYLELTIITSLYILLYLSVLDVLLSESWLIGGLTGLGLSLSDSYSLAQIPVHTQSQSFAVDMRTDSVIVGHVTFQC